MNSRASNVGKPERFALAFIRAMFMSGRNMRIRPSTQRYAFMPSNSWEEKKEIELFLSVVYLLEKMFLIGDL